MPSARWPTRNTRTRNTMVVRLGELVSRTSRGAPHGPRVEHHMKEQAASLDVYRGSTGVPWTYVSPPPGNFAPGKRPGHYRTGLEHPVMGKGGRIGLPTRTSRWRSWTR